MYDLLLHHENILDYVGSGGEMQNILWRNLLSHIIKCHGDLILISCYDEYICCLHIFMGHPWVNAINQNGGKTMALDDIFCSDDFYSFWKTKNFPLNILRIAQFLLQRIIKSPQNIYLPQKTFSFAIHRNRLPANQSFFSHFLFRHHFHSASSWHRTNVFHQIDMVLLLHLTKLILQGGMTDNKIV